MMRLKQSSLIIEALLDWSARSARVLIILSSVTLLAACVTTPLVDKPGAAKESSSSNPTQTSKPIIAPELLQLDVEQIINSVEQIHPEAFSVVKKHQFLQAAQRVKQSIYYPMSATEYYLRVAPLVTMLRDVHSHIAIPKQPLLAQHLSKQNSEHLLFPLAVLYEANSLYVAADLSDRPSVPAGAKITSINGIPIDFMLSKMTRLIAWETETGLRRKVQIEFPWLILALGYAGETYAISYQWQQQTYTRRLPAIKPVLPATDVLSNADTSETNEAGKSLAKQSSTEDDSAIVELNSQNSFYGYSQIGEQTALLWFNDFYESPEVFESFLQQQFDKFASHGIENLIIDLRYNDGGRSQNIKSLLSYLSREPLYWSHRAEIKISQPLQALHALNTEKRRRSKFSWGLQWLPLEWTDWLQYEISWANAGEKVIVDFEPIQPADPVFQGRITVLTNGFCYSACAAFVATVNSHGIAETIGETAGSIARVQYVYPIATRLKHSQLTLTLPTVKVQHGQKLTTRQIAIGVSDKLVSPNIPIERSIEQISTRQDAILHEALKRVQVH